MPAQRLDVCDTQERWMNTSVEISRAEIESLYNPEAVMDTMHAALRVAIATPSGLVRFLSRYANLNAWFGSGVASLAGKIGRSRGIFVDPNEPILDLADRSVLVASYFFDAARDEFDDRDTEYRDTHRCLAQACIKGSIEFFRLAGHGNKSTVNALLEQPLWLQGIGSRVASGYGVTTSELGVDLFRSMGYHIGSEILADQEFSEIDRAFKNRWPELVQFLRGNTFEVYRQKHPGYAWIGLHSGDGSAKEVEHFEAATAGVRTALSLVPEASRDAYRHQVHLGIGSFVRDHQEFFGAVSTD
jgi:hypothetical protein